MEKLKKNGFTLIELLAVIVILAIIALIAVPVIINIINKANRAAFKDTAYGILNAGELYFAEQQLDVNGMNEDVIIELPDTTNKLELKGEIPEGTITISKEGKIYLEVFNGRYCAIKRTNDNDITIKEGECDYSLGSQVYFNPVTDEICTDYEESNSVTGIKDGCLKWYVYRRSGEKIYMILDHNTTSSVDWLSLGDIIDNDLMSAITESKKVPPITLINQLKIDTENWQVPAYVLSNEEMLQLIPYFKELKKQGINWQDKFEEYASMVISKFEEVGNNFDESIYETEDELLDALLDEFYQTGYYLPKYMYKDIFKSLLLGNTDVSGYWTGSHYPNFKPSDEHSLGSFLGFFILEGISIVYPFPLPVAESYEESGITVPGVRPTIVINIDGKAIEKPDAVQIELTETNISMITGDTYQLYAQIYNVSNENYDDKLVWSSSDTSVVIVDENGLVSSLKDGKATITVKLEGNSDIKNTTAVTVKTYEHGIMKSTNSCIRTGICEAGTKIKVSVNESEVHNFYVINDNGNELSMILETNLGRTMVPWISAEDYDDDANYGSYGKNDKGPITAVKELKERTVTWSKVPERAYTYSDDGGGNKYTSFTETMRARLLTFTDLITLGCQEHDGNCPKWLYGDLSETNGYWLSSAEASSENFRAHCMGDDGNYSVCHVSGSLYIRPVITLTK